MEFKTYKKTLEKLGAIKSPYYINNNYIYFLNDLMFTFVDNNDDDKKNSNDNNSLRWNTFVWGKEGFGQVRGLIPKRVIDELIDYDDFFFERGLAK